MRKNSYLKLIGIILVVVYILSLTIWSPKTIKASNFTIQEQKENYLPAEIIDTNPKVMINMSEEIEKARQMLIERNSPLVDYVEVFFAKAPSVESARLAIAISGKETGFGTTGNANNLHNAWGIMCWNPDRHLCEWDSWEYSIKRIYDSNVTGNYYLGFDGTYESLKRLFEGRYCTEGCNTWLDDVWYFYNQL